MLPSGKTIEVFSIGTLAKTLNRSSTTIRRWEHLGIIPTTFFTSPRGFRMYSQEQIDLIARCAKEAKIKHGVSIADTEFSVILFKEMEKLRKKYSSKE